MYLKIFYIFFFSIAYYFAPYLVFLVKRDLLHFFSLSDNLMFSLTRVLFTPNSFLQNLSFILSSFAWSIPIHMWLSRLFREHWNFSLYVVFLCVNFHVPNYFVSFSFISSTFLAVIFFFSLHSHLVLKISNLYSQTPRLWLPLIW